MLCFPHSYLSNQNVIEFDVLIHFMNPIKYLADAVWFKSDFNEHVSKSDFFETDICGQFRDYFDLIKYFDGWKIKPLILPSYLVSAILPFP